MTEEMYKGYMQAVDEIALMWFTHDYPEDLEIDIDNWLANKEVKDDKGNL